jgi:hypothetical protein
MRRRRIGIERCAPACTLACALALAAACSGDGSSPDAGQDAAAGDADAATEVVGDAPVEAPDAPGEVPDAAECPCICDLAKGQAFRFTSMVCVTPPDAVGTAAEDGYGTLCDLLNSIWERDIGKEIQSIIYEVRSVSGCDTGTASFSIELGSGGKREADGTPCPATGATDCDGKFHLLEGYHGPFETYMKGCHFEAQKPGTYQLLFHPGETADPVMCAPGDAPEDDIPFLRLTSAGSFSQDCLAVTGGTLSGCVPKAAADGLCLCNDLTYHDCARSPVPGGDGFCATECGLNFGMNIGGFFASVLGPVNCDIDGDGKLDDLHDGWWIHGTFEAALVPAELYEPLP